jgi:hypothetical protein
MIPRPIGIRVLAKGYEEPSDGLYLPASAITTRRAAVVEIGEDVRYIQVADEILYATQDSRVLDFSYDGERWLVMPEASVLLVLSRHPSAV